MSGTYKKQQAALPRFGRNRRSRKLAFPGLTHASIQRVCQSGKGKASTSSAKLPVKAAPADESDSSEEDSDYETKVSRGPTKGLANISCEFRVAGHVFDERLNKTSLEEVLYFFSDEKTTEEILALMSNED